MTTDNRPAAAPQRIAPEQLATVSAGYQIVPGCSVMNIDGKLCVYVVGSGLPVPIEALHR